MSFHTAVHVALLSAIVYWFVPCDATEPNTKEFGVLLGSIMNSSFGLHGDVYLVNRTHAMIRNFHLKKDDQENPMVYRFYVSTNAVAEIVTDIYEIMEHDNGDYCKPRGHDMSDGFKGSNFVLRLPTKLGKEGETNHKDWTWIGVITEEHWQYLSAVKIDEVRAPEPYCCIRDPSRSDVGLAGAWYGVKTGPIEVLDTKTLLIPDFSFQGSKPPDGWWFAGKGTPLRHSGKKAFIEGRDSKALHCAMHSDYKDVEMAITLAEDQTIYDINFLSVYCYAVGVDFGHIKFKLPENVFVPPYIPPVRNEPPTIGVLAWSRPRLIKIPKSKSSVVTFKFARGPPGEARARAMRNVCQELRSVWYVDGEMTPELWLLRGHTYIFDPHGGSDHPLYLTSEETGGWALKPLLEKRLVSNYAGGDGKSYGPECLFRQKFNSIRADDFDTFTDYAEHLDEVCHDGQGKVIEWTVPDDAPDMLYYGSYKAYSMGGPIRVCNKIQGTAEQPECL